MVDTLLNLRGAYTPFIILCLLLLVVLGGIVVWYGTKKTAAESVPMVSPNSARIFMKLKAIRLLPDDPSEEVQVVAYVNGTEYFYPARESDNWLSVTSDMSEHTIELLAADMFYIRFELNFKSDKKLEGGPSIVRGLISTNDTQKAQRSMPMAIPNLPFSSEYKLYLLSDGSRDLSLKAVIPYEIYALE